MPPIGPNFTGTGANFNDGGTTAWATPTNVEGDNTGTAATFNTGTAGGTSQRLRCSNFGFSIPNDATIDGVTVEIEQVAANTNRHRWNSVRLLVAGTTTGNENSDASTITNSKVFKTFGGPTDGWGASLTPSIVNASGFGVSLKVERFGTATTTSISRVRITVDYTEAGTDYTRPQSDSVIIEDSAIISLEMNRSFDDFVTMSDDAVVTLTPGGGGGTVVPIIVNYPIQRNF